MTININSFDKEYSFSGRFSTFEKNQVAQQNKNSKTSSSPRTLYQEINFIDKIIDKSLGYTPLAELISNTLNKIAGELNSTIILAPIGGLILLVAKITESVNAYLNPPLEHGNIPKVDDVSQVSEVVLNHKISKKSHSLKEDLLVDVVRGDVTFFSPELPPEGKTYIDRSRSQESQKKEQSDNFIRDILNTNNLKALTLLPFAHQGLGFGVEYFGTNLAYKIGKGELYFNHNAIVREITYSKTTRKVHYTSQPQFFYWSKENEQKVEIHYDLDVKIDLNKDRIRLKMHRQNKKIDETK